MDPSRSDTPSMRSTKSQVNRSKSCKPNGYSTNVKCGSLLRPTRIALLLLPVRFLLSLHRLSAAVLLFLSPGLRGGFDAQEEAQKYRPRSSRHGFRKP